MEKKHSVHFCVDIDKIYKGYFWHIQTVPANAFDLTQVSQLMTKAVTGKIEKNSKEIIETLK